jgi:transposase
MMGVQGPQQGKLFYININLEKRIRLDHPLRRIAEAVDFGFAYRELSDKYGANGNVSVPPPVVLKLMLLLVFYNVRSERELMSTVPERLDWLWFLGYDLDSDIPGKKTHQFGPAYAQQVKERIIRAGNKPKDGVESAPRQKERITLGSWGLPAMTSNFHKTCAATNR